MASYRRMSERVAVTPGSSLRVRVATVSSPLYSGGTLDANRGSEDVLVSLRSRFE